MIQIFPNDCFVLFVFVLFIIGPPKKRKRIENVMEEFLDIIAAEKEEKKEEMERREANREKIREKNRKERERRHNEQMDIQKSLVSILQQFLNKT